jgi:hypothetical protein
MIMSCMMCILYPTSFSFSLLPSSVFLLHSYFLSPGDRIRFGVPRRNSRGVLIGMGEDMGAGRGGGGNAPLEVSSVSKGSMLLEMPIQRSLPFGTNVFLEYV